MGNAKRKVHFDKKSLFIWEKESASLYLREENRMTLDKKWMRVRESCSDTRLYWKTLSTYRKYIIPPYKNTKSIIWSRAPIRRWSWHINIFMKSGIIFRIFGLIFIGLLGYFWYKYHTNNLYIEYVKLYEYRRLHPDFQPHTDIIKVTSAWHTNIYADSIWINLIQYIGDNAGNGKFRLFLNPLIKDITALHPYFTNAYNLSLLLSPGVTNEENKKITELSLHIGEVGIEKTCDFIKIQQINDTPFGKELWENTKLKNPCQDGMLPYNLAYVASELGQVVKAEKYYKIASMNTDAPLASRFLGPLMIGKKWDHMEAAEKFLLIAIDGYDEDPYTCVKVADTLLGYVKTKNISTYIWDIPALEQKISPPKDTKNPLASTSTNCHTSVTRAIKQIYLSYITNIAKDRLDIRTGNELIKSGLMSSIPTTQEQNGWSVIRNADDTWRYIEKKYLTP